jgi:ribosomal protein S18 acetylase RimI-like enzyme
MLRPTVPADSPFLTALAESTGVFKPMEIEALREVLDDYHAFEHAHGHFAVTCEMDGEIVGFTYYAPAYMTDRSWYLYWIAVSRTVQGKGVGGELLRAVEEHIRSLNGRMLFLETSGLPHYELTRRFYLKHKYDVTGIIKDFYSDGDDMFVFRKRLS